VNKPRYLARLIAALFALLLLIPACSTLRGFLPEPELATPSPATSNDFQFQTPDVALLPPTATTRPFVLPTPLPATAAPPTPTPAHPWATGDIHLYPGPRHYAGDILSIELRVENFEPGLARGVRLFVDGIELPTTEGFAFTSPWEESFLVLPEVWDTTGDPGIHTVHIELPPGSDGIQPDPLVVSIEVLPADQKPAQELAARWEQRDLPCCTLFYLTETAAARDIDKITPLVEQAFNDVERRLGLRITNRPIPITLIDVVWGHGGLATGNSGIVLSYVDRAYISQDLPVTLRHEIAHWAAFQVTQNYPTILSEGLATYVAGGHFKPEPLPARAAALVALNRYLPLGALADDFRGYQHEAAYLEAGALVYYLINTHGLNSFLAMIGREQAGAGAEWLDAAFQQQYGLTLAMVERDFRAWLAEQDAATQLDDLRVTLALYPVLRRYQDLYAPFEMALPLAEDPYASSLISSYIREPTDPENAAMEAMLFDAQRALRAQKYDSAEEFIGTLESALRSGDFTLEPLRSYLGAAYALRANGYEMIDVTFEGDQAAAHATRQPPQIELVTLMRQPDGTWQVISRP